MYNIPKSQTSFKHQRIKNRKFIEKVQWFVLKNGDKSINNFIDFFIKKEHKGINKLDYNYLFEIYKKEYINWKKNMVRKYNQQRQRILHIV